MPIEVDVKESKLRFLSTRDAADSTIWAPKKETFCRHVRAAECAYFCPKCKHLVFALYLGKRVDIFEHTSSSSKMVENASETTSGEAVHLILDKNHAINLQGGGYGSCMMNNMIWKFGAGGKAPIIRRMLERLHQLWPNVFVKDWDILIGRLETEPGYLESVDKVLSERYVEVLDEVGKMPPIYLMNMGGIYFNVASQVRDQLVNLPQQVEEKEEYVSI